MTSLRAPPEVKKIQWIASRTKCIRVGRGSIRSQEGGHWEREPEL